MTHTPGGQVAVKLPAPAEDGKIYLSEYLLKRWEHKGKVTFDWLNKQDQSTAYTINGKVYKYDGVRLAPKVNDRRRTFFQAILIPV